MQQEPPPPPQALCDSHSPTRSSEGPSAVGRATPPGRAQDGAGGGCDLPGTPHGEGQSMVSTPGPLPLVQAAGASPLAPTPGKVAPWLQSKSYAKTKLLKFSHPPVPEGPGPRLMRGQSPGQGSWAKVTLEGTWDLRQERRGLDSRPCSVGLVDFLGAPSAVPRDQEAPGGCPPLRVLGACPGNVSGGSGVRPGHGGPCAHSGGREAPVSSEILRGEWTGWGCGTLSTVFQKVFLGPSEREGGDRSTGARSGPAWPPSHAPSGHRNFPGSLSSLVLR